MSALVETTVDLPDGTRLAVQVVGPADAPTLLLLQGQGSSHTWWSRLRGRYDGFRTVTIDYRGTGATRDDGAELSTTLLASDAIAALDSLDVDRAHVYGTSMGGRVAQVLAAGHPDRVATLALACTSPGGPHAVERSQDVRRALADPDPAVVKAALVDLFWTPALPDRDTRTHLFGDRAMSGTDRVRHLKLSARHDAWDLLPTIACPTFVLHGTEDRMTPPASSELIAGRIPDARLHLHEGGRHGFFEEFADDLDPLLLAHWR